MSRTLRLPSHEPLVRNSERVRAQIESFAAQRGEDELLWCYLPRLLWSAHGRMAEPHRIPSDLPRREVRRMRALHVSRRSRSAPGGIAAKLGDGCLFMATTTNMQRSQAPLYERFGPLRDPQVPRPPLRRTRALTRQAIDLAGELIAFARANRLEMVMDAGSLHQLFLRAAKLLAVWECVVATERPRAVVVGSLWQPRARALLHAARRAGIPTVYVPHAPLLADVYLMDLAVDYAGLRGPGEMDFLTEHGVGSDRLLVIGNPSIVAEPPPELDQARPPVFAPSTERATILHPLIEVVHEALGSRVVVGRHPNADPAGASAFPGGWHIHQGRTYDLLRDGPPVVLQPSSGIALEALHLGIPVIELHFPGTRPAYPLIREPYVRFASTSHELARAVSDATADARDGERRQQLIDWARHWASPAGAQASERVVALLEQAIAGGPRAPIWDITRRLPRPLAGAPLVPA